MNENYGEDYGENDTERWMSREEMKEIQDEATDALRRFDAWMRETYPDEDNPHVAAIINSGTCTIAWIYLYAWMKHEENQ